MVTGVIVGCFLTKRLLTRMIELEVQASVYFLLPPRPAGKEPGVWIKLLVQ